jgi:thiol:disulfide interchange protein
MQLFSCSLPSALKLVAKSSLISAVLTLAFSPNIALANPAITWSTQVESSFDAAKRAHKYVLADVYTDWCGWCKRLDQQTFSDDKMISFLNGKFVCIKANAEDNGEGAKLAQKYKVAGFPCALVFDQSGKYIGKISGFFEPEEYQAQVTKLIEHPQDHPEI